MADRGNWLSAKVLGQKQAWAGGHTKESMCLEHKKQEGEAEAGRVAFLKSVGVRGVDLTLRTGVTEDSFCFVSFLMNTVKGSFT